MNQVINTVLMCVSETQQKLFMRAGSTSFQRLYKETNAAISSKDMKIILLDAAEKAPPTPFGRAIWK